MANAPNEVRLFEVNLISDQVSMLLRRQGLPATLRGRDRADAGRRNGPGAPDGHAPDHGHPHAKRDPDKIKELADLQKICADLDGQREEATAARGRRRAAAADRAPARGVGAQARRRGRRPAAGHRPRQPPGHPARRLHRPHRRRPEVRALRVCRAGRGRAAADRHRHPLQAFGRASRTTSACTRNASRRMRHS